MYNPSLSRRGPNGYEYATGKTPIRIPDSWVSSNNFPLYLAPYVWLILVSHSSLLAPVPVSKNSNSSLSSPYDETSENKLNWVSARSTPSNVLLTSLDSGNCSWILRTGSDFFCAIILLWIFISSVVLPDRVEFSDNLYSVFDIFLDITVPWGIWLPLTLSPTLTPLLLTCKTIVLFELP